MLNAKVKLIKLTNSLCSLFLSLSFIDQLGSWSPPPYFDEDSYPSPPLPGIWKVYQAVVLSSPSHQDTPVGCQTAISPSTTCSMSAPIPALPTYLVQLRAALWIHTAARPAAPSTQSAWWCPFLWHLTTFPAAPFPECTTVHTTTARETMAPLLTVAAAVEGSVLAVEAAGLGRWIVFPQTY